MTADDTTPPAAARPEIDVARLLSDLDHLATIGAEAGGGVSRVAYSAADVEARLWVRQAMLDLGMEARRDEALNIIGRYPGREAGLGAVALGSHTDTVPSGGRFDGALGVVAGLACVRALRNAGVRLRHPVEVIDFAAEEGVLGIGVMGSQAMVNGLSSAALERTAWDGRPAADHVRDAGLDPRAFARAVRPRRALAGYLELHIEQGRTLEDAGIPIGVVEGIVGMRRFAATFEGVANHAGTTAMPHRRDALVMAAPFILDVRDAATAAGIVGTVGAVRVHPNAVNVIPGRVELTVGIRGLDDGVMDRVEEQLAAAARGRGGELRRLSAGPPVLCHPTLIGAVEAACDAVGLARLRMPSGAGHDAMVLAQVVPQAMVFVPSRGGVSHSPDELTAPERCADGARVLLAALLESDRRLDPDATS